MTLQNQPFQNRPLQNRVSPDGDIVATPARGTVYGNRGGCFHREDGSLKARLWANRQWICCVLQFKNRRRTLRQPGKFTELFFLDEATAFAAGHRPCFECRRADAESFRGFWAAAYGVSQSPAAPAMDLVLHSERLDEKGAKRTAAVAAADLPDGVIVRHESAAWLLQRGRLHKWSFEGYGAPAPMPNVSKLTCLTPPAIVATIRSGYRPQLHPSARAEG